MSDLVVRIPRELVLEPKDIIEESRLPLLPAAKLKGTIHPDRLPPIPADRISGTLPDSAIPPFMATGDDIAEAIGAHEQASDPHPQYARDSDLAAAIATLATAAHTHPYPFFDGQNWQWKQNNRPLARPDSSALAVGDTWLDTSDRLPWFWNGFYWLSEQIFIASSIASTIGTTTGLGLIPTPYGGYDIFFISFTVAGYFNSPQNATDYWSIQLERVQPNGTQSQLAAHVLNTYTHTSGLIAFRAEMPLFIHQDVSAIGNFLYRIAAFRFGVAGSIPQPSFTVRYHLVKP